MSNSRFVIGNKYLFIHILTKDMVNKSLNEFFHVPFIFETNPEIIKITILELECIEEHDVAWVYDIKETKKYKGYVFKSEDGNIWHNQYPYANYSQTDDSEDYRITISDNCYNSGLEIVSMELASTYLNNAYRIYSRLSETNELSGKLLQHYNTIKDMLKEVFNKDVVLEDKKIGNNIYYTVHIN